MKKKHVWGIVICCIAAMLLLVACPPLPDLTGDDDDDGPVTETWSISGTVKFTNSGSSPANNIKLAAFYTGNGLTLYTTSEIVSNVVNLGNDTITGSLFSLSIDASTVTPYDGYYIKLVMWEDEDGNNAYDSGEYSQTVVPDMTTGCPCFGDYSSLASCHYYYEETSNWLMGTSRGWNQRTETSTTDDYTPINSATKTGAKIEVYYAFNTDA